MTHTKKINEDAVILGIESSCDETAAAVTKGRRILSSVIASQIEIHKRFGGVVPEVASRNHTLTITGVIDSALKQAGLSLGDIDLIAVTDRPGLAGALMVGVATAEALSLAQGIPLLKVNHIEAHICAAYANTDLQPPFAALVASGGHTSLIDAGGYNKYTQLLATADDAVGEAFDKVGRYLGLPYPGGPAIDRLAALGKPCIKFIKSKGADAPLSYSGLKTAVVNYVNNLKNRDEPVPLNDICASFTVTAIDRLVSATIGAAQKHGRDTIVIAGGVASNSYLRRRMAEETAGRFRLYMPPPELCTDNAVMVALRGYAQNV